MKQSFVKSHEVRIKELSVIKRKVQVKKVNPICLQFLNHSNLDRKFTFPKFGLTPLTIWKISLTIIFWFFFFTIPTFGETKDSKKTELYRYNKLTLQNHPVRNPRSLPSLCSRSSDLPYSTELKSEGVILKRENLFFYSHIHLRKSKWKFIMNPFSNLSIGKFYRKKSLKTKR
ncbi:conserved hypothetical protein [Leptospira interrogans serovar Copenhageni str. Fiocruz L1-130]|uniref:Uncharacterized protein n=1 Tax=Leptospira interrogans serogroup Icterohaemorrhagiae serovar copenhageni (strain Fiocruz L1-130) TaxID=267671 RepID=Q72RZ5_LEPIC|nr:conserved hypothetical protein [Leptospira interrogans serovar Copenhageni str. Fiocruz L1-130]